MLERITKLSLEEIRNGKICNGNFYTETLNCLIVYVTLFYFMHQMNKIEQYNTKCLNPVLNNVNTSDNKEY